jgi:murein DD-endopeptidase MepM/ murein hydrolase activator NlpD
MRIVYRLLWLVSVLGLVIYATSLTAQEESDPGVTIHVVQRGDNLYRIALQYGTTTDELVRLNGLTNAASIQVGQRLLVPVDSERSVVEAARTHVVRPGETLRSIAQLYNVTIEQLVQWNEIASAESIYVGQSLRLAPADVVLASVEDSADDLGLVVAEESPGEAVVDGGQSSGNQVHVVQRGETLFSIATNYGITVNELAQANSIADPTRIFSGQQLVIPVEPAAPVAVSLPDPVTGLEITPQMLLPGRTMQVVVTTSTSAAVSGRLLDRDLYAAAEGDNTRHILLQGIPMFTEPGIYPLVLTVTDNQNQQIDLSINVQVGSGNYGRERINLLAGRGSLLDPSLEQSEESRVATLASVFNQTRMFDGPMALPAAATIISPFGTIRSYNGGPFDRFHSGTDFAGAPGTPVLATAPGRVVLAEMLSIRGGATVIDHGWGVFTGYWHQAQQYVQPGDMVTTGQVIGTIGSTGRVTGAHLHWELWVGGVPVDPMQWVRQTFN